jgi:hypothetical protein
MKTMLFLLKSVFCTISFLASVIDLKCAYLVTFVSLNSLKFLNFQETRFLSGTYCNK